ncbi:MAG: hypothetical protein KJZ93_21345 [Caldilineaceae bacterium]|nr:hypothetical protein [Caldilineaceae bacterium]
MNNLSDLVAYPAQAEASDIQHAAGRNHRTVLVRFWRVDESQPWRATLLYLSGEAPEHFASASQLFAHLWGLLENGASHDKTALETDVSNTIRS